LRRAAGDRSTKAAMIAAEGLDADRDVVETRLAVDFLAGCVGFRMTTVPRRLARLDARRRNP
jgi:hypothetical protein